MRRATRASVSQSHGKRGTDPGSASCLRRKPSPVAGSHPLQPERNKRCTGHSPAASVEANHAATDGWIAPFTPQFTLNLSGEVDLPFVPGLTLAGRALAGSADGGSILVMADTVAPEAVAVLAGTKRAATTLFALLPADTDAGALSEAARAIGATLVPTTVDQADVTAVVRRLDSRDAAASVAGAGSHWREAGYWLVPLLALLTLASFRRGWGLA